MPSDPLQWYAAYTRFRYEKSVAQALESRGVEHYLPLYETMHRWKDRKMRLQLPLFPSYVFVCLDLQDRLSALTVPGVIRLVGNPYPQALAGSEVEAIKNHLSHGLAIEPYPYLTDGKRVRVIAGPFMGLEGFVLRRKSSCRIVISLDLIQRSMVLEVPSSDLELVRPRIEYLSPVFAVTPKQNRIQPSPGCSNEQILRFNTATG